MIGFSAAGLLRGGFMMLICEKLKKSEKPVFSLQTTAIRLY